MITKSEHRTKLDEVFDRFEKELIELRKQQLVEEIEKQKRITALLTKEPVLPFRTRISVSSAPRRNNAKSKQGRQWMSLLY